MCQLRDPVYAGAVAKQAVASVTYDRWRLALSAVSQSTAEAVASTRLWLPLGLIDAIHRSGPGGSPSRK